MHNCNVLFMVTELLLNKMPISLSHFPVVMLWGMWYVVFAWWWLRRSGQALFLVGGCEKEKKERTIESRASCAGPCGRAGRTDGLALLIRGRH